MINVFFYHLTVHPIKKINSTSLCLRYNVVNDGAASTGMSINSKISFFSDIILLSTTLQGQLNDIY